MKIRWPWSRIETSLRELVHENAAMRGQIKLLSSEFKRLSSDFDYMRASVVNLIEQRVSTNRAMTPRRELADDPSQPPPEFADEPWAKDVDWEKVN